MTDIDDDLENLLATTDTEAGIPAGVVDPATGEPVPSGELAYAVHLEMRRRDARAIADRIVAARDAVDTLAIASVPGGRWLFADYVEKPALWGRDDEVLLAADESLLIVSPPGVGKTTLATELVAGFAGLRTEVLGYPVQPVGRALYLAMDRPAQIGRAMRRVFTASDQDVLDERLVIRPGPIAGDLGQRPEILLQLALEQGADVVIVDSAKDAVAQLTDDLAGGNFNRAVQMCLAAGIAVIVLHHQRKATEGRKPNKLDDVYGSTWITAGAGSVVLLWGEPGSGSAELVHLKTPATPVGPLSIEINTSTGTMTTTHGWDPLAFLRHRTNGATVPEAAAALAGGTPTSADRGRARRKLDALVARGLAHCDTGQHGGPGGSIPARYHATTDHQKEPTE